MSLIEKPESAAAQAANDVRRSAERLAANLAKAFREMEQAVRAGGGQAAVDAALGDDAVAFTEVVRAAQVLGAALGMTLADPRIDRLAAALAARKVKDATPAAAVQA